MVEAKEDKKRQTFRSSYYKAFFFLIFLSQWAKWPRASLSRIKNQHENVPDGGNAHIKYKATIYFFQKTLDQRLKGAEILVYWTSTREYNK